MSLKIAEYFVSIIGEGSHIGKRALFIRLFGCSKNCSFCDTPQGKGEGSYVEMGIERLIVIAHDLKASEGLTRVVITGGEPGEQYAELNDLARELNNRGFTLHLETNGEHKGINYAMFQWVTVCPKGSFTLAWDKIKMAEGLEFKFLHDWNDPDGSVASYRGIMQTAENKYGYKPIATVQLMDKAYNATELLQGLKAIVSKNYYPEARVLPQLHKLIGVK